MADANIARKRVTLKGKNKSLIAVYMFLVSLFIPWIFSIGDFALSVYRLFLLFATLPCVFMWLSGKAGRIRLPDIAFLLFWAWCGISFVAVDGLSASIQPIGIHFIETMGPYFLARCYIRTADDFYRMIAFAFKIVAVVFPFALFETITHWNIARIPFAAVLPTIANFDMPLRWGMRRAHAVFEHPILFGVSTGSIFAMVHVVLGYGQSGVKRLLRSGIVAVTAFTSFSAGPISALVFQGLLLAWNWIMRGFAARWRILWGLLGLGYILVTLASNQTVPEFFFHHFSFDSESSNYRVLIWIFGSQSVMNHPLFGTTFGEWDRPEWMPPSIDMFWLFYAIQNGLPAGLLMILGFGSAYLAIAFKKGLDDKLYAYRMAYLITMTGFFMVGWTVHFWNATYVLFMFLVGSGVWLLDVEGEAPKRKRSGATIMASKQANQHAMPPSVRPANEPVGWRAKI